MKTKTLTAYAVVQEIKKDEYEIYRQMNDSYCIYSHKKFASYDMDSLAKNEKVVKVEIKIKQ